MLQLSFLGPTLQLSSQMNATSVLGSCPSTTSVEGKKKLKLTHVCVFIYESAKEIHVYFKIKPGDWDCTLLSKRREAKASRPAGYLLSEPKYSCSVLTGVNPRRSKHQVQKDD